MQTTSQTPESRLGGVQETIEARQMPLPETATMMLQEGRQQVTDVKGSMENIRRGLKGPDEDVFSDDFWNLERELDSAHAELQKEVDDIMKGGGAPADIAGMIQETLKQGAKEGKLEQQPGKELPPWLEPNLDALEREGRVKDAAFEVIDSDHVPFETLDQIADLDPKNEGIRRLFAEKMATNVGKKYAERILSDAGYRQSLSKLQETLSKRYGGEESPMLCEKTPLQDLVAINEILGNRAESIVKTLDLRSYGRGLDTGLRFTKMPDGNYSDLIKVFGTTFDDEGNLVDAQVDVGFTFDGVGPDGKPNKENALIHRSFMRQMRELPDGTLKTEFIVRHELFDLPSSIKGGGLAAEVTRSSLAEYDKLGADAIALSANIDVGGYAWASYGYGWDVEKYNLKKTSGEWLKADIQTVAVGIRTFMSTLEDAEGTVTDAQKQDILDALEKIAQNPLACTPQFLAGIGKGGPVLQRGESGKWYTNEAFQQAVKDGRERGEAGDFKGPMHAGKFGMLGSHWQGRLDLKPDGPQGGKNRKLLEEKISRSTK